MRHESFGHTDEVWALGVSSDGKRVLSGGFDCDVRYWNLRTGQSVKVLKGHSNVVNSVQFTPDGRYAVSGSDDRRVKIWDLKRGECVRSLLGHLRTVYSVAVSPDGNLVASTGFLDETVRLWSFESGDCLQVLSNIDRASPVSVVFSRDGRRLVVGTATPDAVYVYRIPHAVVPLARPDTPHAAFERSGELTQRGRG
jgi:COMPASS component SWD3